MNVYQRSCPERLHPDLPESSLFKGRRVPSLPLPIDIQAINESSNGIRAGVTTFNRPYPVKFPSLMIGLLVKYGADVTVVEALIQMVLCEKFTRPLTRSPCLWLDHRRVPYIGSNAVERLDIACDVDISNNIHTNCAYTG